MSTCYVVYKPFKSNGVFYPVGTVLTSLDGIKTCRIKIHERKLIPIGKKDATYDRIKLILKVRHEVDLDARLEQAYATPTAKKVAAEVAPKAAPEKKVVTEQVTAEELAKQKRIAAAQAQLEASKLPKAKAPATKAKAVAKTATTKK